jgi:steroid delta-isomerase-like uncharacterized protein
MSIEQNKTNFRRVPEEIFNQGKLELIDEIFAADYVEHVPLPPGMPAGREAVKQFIAMLRAAFPDLHYTIEDELAEGDMVVDRVTVQGTHQGDFMGIPASGKQATWGEIHMGRFASGKLVEHWANQDQLGMLQQLGIIPTPDQ